MNQQFAGFYKAFHQQLLLLLPLQTDLRAAYEGGTEEQQVFVQNLALFYTGFFKVSRGLLRCVQVTALVCMDFAQLNVGRAVCSLAYMLALVSVLKSMWNGCLAGNCCWQLTAYLAKVSIMCAAVTHQGAGGVSCGPPSSS